MNLQPLFDLSPLFRLMLVGIALAAGPLVWVWWRGRHATPVKRLHALTVLTLVLTFDLVLFGAFTRLTDSGLGCPDWPGCYGNASPLGASAQISAAQAAMPTGPVTASKAWIEMIHRYLATGVGVLILVVAAASWRNDTSSAHSQKWWAMATLVWVCVQGAFGALTVTMKLFPAIVTLHLLGAMVLLVLLTVQVQQQSRDGFGDVVPGVTATLRTLLWSTFAALILQIALGGWVSTNYAVLACREFPQCQGEWWPAMDFAQGFQLWRELGLTRDGSNIGFEALTAVHMAHRMMALVVVVLASALILVLRTKPALQRAARWFAVLLGLQVITGLSNVVFDWPLAAALLHTGGAAALVIVMTWLAARTSGNPDDLRVDNFRKKPLAAQRLNA